MTRWAEVLFVVVALLGFGAISAAVVPPCQVPDEGYSFLRAYHVASGHLRPELIGGWGGGRFPPAPLRIVEVAGPLVNRPDRKFTPTDQAFLAELDDGGEPRAVPYPTAAPYTFVPFIPQAVGIAVARAVGLAPLPTFYAGRFANLLFGTALVALALGLAPVGRRFLGLVALLPMTVHLFGSYAPDVMVVGSVLVLVAFVTRLATAGGRRATGWELVGLAVAVAGIAASKPPYLPLTLLVLAVPSDRLGGIRGRVAFGSGLLAVGAGVAAVGVHLTRPYYPDPNDLFGFQTSVQEQTRFVVTHPWRFAEVFLTTVGGQGVAACYRLYTLGWVDTGLDPVAVGSHILLLVLFGVAARRELGALSRAMPLCAAAAAGGGLGLVVLSMYLWCTPPGAPVAVGFHGRYLLPLIPALPFMLPGRMGAVVAAPFTTRYAAGAAAVLIQLTAIGAVVDRYYATPSCRWTWIFAGLLAALAAALVIATVWKPRTGRQLPRGAGGTGHYW